MQHRVVVHALMRAALAVAILASVCAANPVVAASDDAPSPFASMEWREIGPWRGGRSAAVTGVPGKPDVYYFGSTGGGVWKTVNGGFSWENVSDGFFGGSIGAVAVSEWDPNVIYVGGGEKTVRGNVSHGDGVWKSTDAGRTWVFAGLGESRHVPRIRIHPRNPDRAWVAALGHLHGPSRQRGVFRTDDGGESWRRVLFVDDEVGAVDLALDPTNPRILYATFWRVRRTPYSLESGGPGSGIWKTVDGGETWEEISGAAGLPEAPLGIIGVTVSPTNPDSLYAIIEAENGGVFRSRDAGKSWERTNQDRSLRQRAWYYTRIYADPVDEETVYVVNVRFHRSRDGGKTFETIDTPHGDNHDLWIDPADSRRMIEANDGGANVSRDGGETWTPQDGQPTSQIYRVSTDNAFPYRLLGGQQDNTALRIRSRSAYGSSISSRDWEPTAGGESGHVVARPDDPGIVYGGSYGGFLTVLNHRTGERRAVNVWPDNPMGWGAADLRYRFQWNFPLFFSPHDSEVLYAAANVLFRTRDGGASWEAISPDLTRNDRSKMGPSGGPITKDNTSVEYYGTIFAALESPHEAGVLWAGSDDGLVHLSRDGGASWQNVTPRQMPEWMQINGMDAHPFETGGLYLAGTRYKLDDFRPYLYRTLDYGRTWKRIDDSIDREHFTRAVRADPDRVGLLYAGTERGVYVSFDDGASWSSLQLELPVTPITDLAVKNRDLVAATQGRGFWILDDLTPLHQMKEAVGKETWLFTPRTTVRLAAGGRSSAEPRHAGKNPPAGVVFHYRLPGALAEDAILTLEILEEDGTVIRTFTRKTDGEESAASEGRNESDDDVGDEGENTQLLDAVAGMNRFVWDMRYPGAHRFKDLVLWNRFLDGPRAVPGRYRARLSAGDEAREVGFEIRPDPRVSASPEDFQAQFDFLVAVRDKVSAAHDTVGEVRRLKGELERFQGRLGATDFDGDLRAEVEALSEELTAVEKGLYQVKMRSRQDPLNYPIQVNDKLAGLLSLAAMGEHAPTRQMLEVRTVLFEAIDARIERWAELRDRQLPELERRARKAGVPLIAAP